MAPEQSPPGVRIRGLTVVYRTPAGELPAVSGVDLDLAPGTITGVVGESGSGKSTLALSLLNAVQPPGRIAAGSVEIDGLGDVVALGGEGLRRARGRHVGYVFQAAQNSLNPLKTVGKQVLDLGRSHGVENPRGLLADARDLLGRMGLDGARVLDSYQHELSGGMRQRVGIMLALVLNARLVVLDEPTTALDMITQATILRIVREVHAERGLTTLVITHDLGVVAEQRAFDRGRHRLQVGPRGHLRHHAAETGVLVHAGGDGVGQQRVAADDAHAGLVAGRLDPQHDRLAHAPPPVSPCRGPMSFTMVMASVPSS